MAAVSTPTPCLDCDGAEIRVGDWVECVRADRSGSHCVERGDKIGPVNAAHSSVFGAEGGVWSSDRFRRLPPQPQPSAAQPEPEDRLGWQPIETAPRDGTWIILAAPSGYTAAPLRCAVGRWYPEYRPLNPWQTHSNDAFTDEGGEPTLWMHLPALPTTPGSAP